MSLSNFRSPVLVDNRRLREEVPEINAHFVHAERELQALPKVNGVVVDPSFVALRDCPICKSSRSSQLFLKWGFIYVTCLQCEHVFVRNQLREDVLLGMYAHSEVDKFDRAVQKSDPHVRYWRLVYEKYLKLLESSGIQNKNLLDIGCGSGAFLSYCKENSDYQLYGAEFADDAFDYLSELLSKERFYFQQRLEDIQFDSLRFGAITMWGVVEHLSEPVEVLRKCRDILDETGRIVLLYPNIYSRAFKILGIQTPTLNPRAHIQMYTHKSLAELCRRTGLAVVDSLPELPVIDLMYPHLDYNDQLLADILEKDETYYRVCVLKRA